MLVIYVLKPIIVNKTTQWFFAFYEQMGEI